MKKLILFLLGALWLVSCTQTDDVDNYYIEYRPVLMTRTELEKSISFQNARELDNTGNIYTKGTYVYINEKFKGIHIIDNQDPQHPQNVGFITVPGCLDMAIRNNTLLVDNAVDLVAIDISDYTHPQVTKRVANAFPEHTFPNSNYLPDQYTADKRPPNTVIVEWIKN